MNPRYQWDPPVDDPVRLRSSDAVNQRIDRSTLDAMALAQRSPEGVQARMNELDREWHLDRALIALFSVVGSFTAASAIRHVRRTGRLGGWGVLLFTQLGFLMHHAVRGWCPPVPVLRRLGFRTAREISAERVALERSVLTSEPGYRGAEG